jgi:hypothetical protein
MIPHTCALGAKLPQSGDISLALAAPPHVSILSISPHIFKNDMTSKNFPSVLTVDPSGILLLHTTQGLSSTPLTVSRPGHMSFQSPTFISVFYICDLVSGTMSELPSPPYPIIDVGNLGLVMVPGGSGSYIVAELRPIIGTTFASLLYFSSETGIWKEKHLHYKLPMRPWGSHCVFSYNHMLWWVDVSWGILSCNPFDCNPVLNFARLPMGKVLRFKFEEKDLQKKRCIGVSGGQIIFAEMSEGVPMRRRVLLHRLRHLDMRRGPNKVYCIKTWKLVSPKFGVWKLKRSAILDSNVWYGETHKASGLPRRKPSLALIHPTHPGIIFFFVGEKVMSLDMATKQVEECGDHNMTTPPSNILSSRFVHAWQLPPMLNSGNA